MSKRAHPMLVVGFVGILVAFGVGAKGEDSVLGDPIMSAVVSVWAGSECKGSGFLISPDGYVLTAAHVIDSVRQAPGALRIGRQTETGYETVFARLVGVEVNAPAVGSDVALLKIDGSGLPYIDVGSSEGLDLGPVTVLGFPSPQITGCERAPDAIPCRLTNLDASTFDEEGTVDYGHVLQMQPLVDVPAPDLQKGLSGGPVIDEAGEAIGLFVAGSKDPMLPYFFASPIDTVLHDIVAGADTLPQHYLGIRSVACGGTVCTPSAAVEVAAHGEAVPLDIGFWSLKGGLNRVRVAFDVETVEFLAATPIAEDERGRFVLVHVGQQAGDRPEGYVHMSFVAREVREREEIGLKLSLITEDGRESQTRDCRIVLTPCRVVVELATFEGREGDSDARQGKWLRDWGAFFKAGRAIAIVGPGDATDRGTGQTALWVDYDVSEESFRDVSVYDRYSGFWMKWEAVGFSFEECTHLCLWLRGGDSEEGLGCTERVKLELKVNNGWGRYGWRIYYLDGITDRWQQFCVPLDDFGAFGTYRAEFNEFVITFEAREVTEARGILWIDDITFLVPGEECR